MSNIKKFFCALALLSTTSTFAAVQQIETDASLNPASVKSTLPIVEQVTILADGTKLSKVKTRGITVFVLQDAQGRIVRSQLEGAAEIQNLHYDDSSVHGLPVARSTTNITTGAVSYRVLRGVSGDERKSFSLEIQDPENFDFNSFSLIIEDPFGFGWEMLGMNPQPPRCKKDTCKELCDAGADVGFVGCGIMALVPGPGPAAAVVCGGVMLGGKYACRGRCDDRCTSLGE